MSQLKRRLIRALRNVLIFDLCIFLLATVTSLFSSVVTNSAYGNTLKLCGFLFIIIGVISLNVGQNYVRTIGDQFLGERQRQETYEDMIATENIELEMIAAGVLSILFGSAL